ncbi:MAG: P-II family nitrogen regulator [Bacteroidales bacterium]|nr:P-II family nitrogen regulator [Bacteroidales bacterium]
MKKIEAIIRKTRFENVKEALFNADINWFSYSEVKAIGQDREDRIYRGIMYSTDIISRIELTIICRDQFVQPAIDAIMSSARTGEVGDGRIFVSPVDDTWSIRTGEHGDIVLADRK